MDAAETIDLESFDFKLNGKGMNMHSGAETEALLLSLPHQRMVTSQTWLLMDC